MAKVLIIGAGGVGGVVAHKCAQVPQVFEEITLASRTVSISSLLQRSGISGVSWCTLPLRKWPGAAISPQCK